MSVSYRPKVIETPSLLGKTIHEAMRIVADKNINLRLLEEREEPDLPEGTILQQNPSAAIPIKPQQSIFCVVSKKGRRVVPSVLGKPMAGIIKELDEQGIVYKHYMLESACPEGTCIAQEPQPGSIVTPAPMILYGAKSVEKTVIVPSFLYVTIPAVKHFLDQYPVTLEVIHTTVISSDHQCDNQCVVSEQSPRAGTLVVLNSQKPLHIQLSVK